MKPLGHYPLTVETLLCLGLTVSATAQATPPVTATPAKTTPQVDENAIAYLDAVGQAFRDVARAARFGVVHIGTDRPRGEDLPGFWGSGSGSGVIVDADGYILTNNHVVAEAERVRVTLHDDEEYIARLVGADPKTDLALLKIDANDLQPLTLGDSDQTEVGDWVLAVGAPFGLKFSVTHGIVSAKGRSNVGGIDIKYQDFIQTDAAINPGNSGGPLLNLRGEVVGINTAIATGGEAANAGVAFTIPVNRVKTIYRELRTDGTIERGFLGISMDDLERGDDKVYGLMMRAGVRIRAILQNTPADEAGLQIGDVVTAVNGIPVSDSQELLDRIAEFSPGDAIALDLVRLGKPRSLEVQLARQPDDMGRSLRIRNTITIPALDGLQVQTMRPTFADRLGLGSDLSGAWVLPMPSGNAMADELEGGDVIVAVNGEPVRHAAALASTLAEQAGREVTLEVVATSRDNFGETRTVRLRLQR